jgi:hypothetical protein
MSQKLSWALIVQITAVILNGIAQMTTLLPATWHQPVGAVLVMVQMVHAIALLYTSPPGTFTVDNDHPQADKIKLMTGQ